MESTQREALNVNVSTISVPDDGFTVKTPDIGGELMSTDTCAVVGNELNDVKTFNRNVSVAPAGRELAAMTK